MINDVASEDRILKLAGRKIGNTVFDSFCPQLFRKSSQQLVSALLTC